MKSKNEVVQPKVSSAAMVKAWFCRYPWLEGHFHIDEIDTVIPYSFDCGVLKKTGGFDSGGLYADYHSVPHLNNKIVLFSMGGKPLGQVGIKKCWVKEKRLFGFLGSKTVWKTILFEETVEQALRRLSPTDMAHFVVGYVEKTLFITIAPTGETFNTAIVKEITKAGNEVEKIVAKMS